MRTETIPDDDIFINEYTREDIIRRYIDRTAGAGIAFVLNHVYAPLYLDAIHEISTASRSDRGFCVLEYGCGGGMNLLKIVELIASQGHGLEYAYGTDFSPPMIEAARREAATHFADNFTSKLRYVVANNQNLVSDLENRAGNGALRGTFDLVVGVNTFRYSHRLNKETRTAQDLYDLLRPGGISIMIDMNRNFPLFRSKLRNILQTKRTPTYIPSLREYVRPFREVGFVIETARHFCWIPHSASRGTLAVCKILSPVLDFCFRPFAMRSLVIARKPR